MGQTLSEPVTDKVSDQGGDARFFYGVSAMQGWRISMEDAHTTVLDILEHTQDSKSTQNNDSKHSNSNSKKPHLAFFGVFDGHGGEKVAKFAGQNIYRILTGQDAFRQGNYEQALKDGFLATDRALLGDPDYQNEISGCTACVALISDDKIFVANAGDSRGVLGVKGRAKPLSVDHKPQNEGEKARILAAGGFVDFGRVNGNLALSRAIGDFEFKKGVELTPEQQMVTAYPDIQVHELSDDDEFLVLACDGIWDCQSSQSVVEFVRRGIAAKQDLHKICENMMDNCLASNSETGGIGCDNMTMIIVAFLRGKTKEQWYQQVADRVASGDGPCAPPEYATFRGPGIHHKIGEGEFSYVNANNVAEQIRRLQGRLILLGDGTTLVTDANSPQDEANDDESTTEEEDRDIAGHHDGSPIAPSKDGESQNKSADAKSNDKKI